MGTSEDWQKDYSRDWQKGDSRDQTLTEKSLDDNSSLKKILQLIESGKEVIDFGCATGYFSRLLQNKGCAVTGVEINPEAAKLAEEYCEKVIIADLDYVSIQDIFPEQKFDIAVFGDVLEHLRNPWRVLEETKYILKEDGYVVASIPNIAHGSIRLSLLQGRFEYTEFGILDNTHIRFFTRETVKKLFEKAGYLADIVDRTKLDYLADNYLIPKNNKHEFSIDTLKKVEEDPDCDTLQFIVRSYPHV
jgi:2-polyprenyl-3-methyl-5-hydroxy-6-metoxy-1,4-benzoquinol methylase